MAEKNPLFAVMIALAAAQRWLAAREIANRAALDKHQVNSILYTHRDLFVRTAEDIPRWQLSSQYGGGGPPAAPDGGGGPPAAPDGGGGGPPAAPATLAAPKVVGIPFKRYSGPSVAVSATAEVESQTSICEACGIAFEGIHLYEVALCPTHLTMRNEALEQFARYDTSLPTMKDFNLYDND